MGDGSRKDELSVFKTLKDGPVDAFVGKIAGVGQKTKEDGDDNNSDKVKRFFFHLVRVIV